MFIHKAQITIHTDGQKLYKITDLVQDKVEQLGISEGICILFIPHTSASIIIQETDPAARRDMEYSIEKLVPENDKNYQHSMEGADDPSSHVKGSLLETSQTIFVEDGKLLLGKWQELYLWEHRRSGRDRMVYIRIINE